MTSQATIELAISADADVRPELIPAREAIESWVFNALAGERLESMVDLRLATSAAMQTLNRTFRDRDRPTNVLSFPAGEMICPLPLLGDIAICPDIVLNEAREQGKAYEAHFAHLLTHGVLHLLGYDHVEPEEAEAMEHRERDILARIGIDDPYQLPTDAPI